MIIFINLREPGNVENKITSKSQYKRSQNIKKTTHEYNDCKVSFIQISKFVKKGLNKCIWENSSYCLRNSYETEQSGKACICVIWLVLLYYDNDHTSIIT